MADDLYRKLEEQYWRIQGRLNAVEWILTSEIFNMAKMQPNPFGWIQAFVEAGRQTSQGLKPDLMPEGEAVRLVDETRRAYDEFLEQIVLHAGQLPGAPRPE